MVPNNLNIKTKKLVHKFILYFFLIKFTVLSFGLIIAVMLFNM